jgi:L-amino acid N-acyltransferase YncA
MFDVFDQISYNNKRISEYNYIIVGQVCIDKNYRGAGVFDNCYTAYKEFYKHGYELAITEIAATNLRSLKAHKRIGFEEIHSYTASNKTEWIIVVWDWKNIMSN